MNRTLKTIGILTCIYVLYLGADYLSEHYAEVSNHFFHWLGIISFAAILIFVALRLIYGKNWMLGTGKAIIVGPGLIEAIKQTLEELPKPSKHTIANLGGQIIYRFTRIAIVGLLLAIIPIALLWQQNKKIDFQNDKIDIQNNLIEAERRSSLVFLMSNILDKVDEEIKEQDWKLKKIDSLGFVRDSVPDNLKFSLSEPLVGRIVALSKGFYPYKVLDGDTLKNELISPERGQLFIALMKNNLDSLTQNTIVADGDFYYARIGEIHLNWANLLLANLRGTDLCWADLRGANLFRADLREADLSRADLREAYLSGIDLSRANLTGAALNEADLTGAGLRGATLNGADFRRVNLHRADLSEANLSWANLSGVDLREAYLSGADLNKANLNGADLSGAHLRETKNCTKEQLLSTVNLYEIKGLSKEMETSLLAEKKCLFTKRGCPLGDD